MSHASGPFWRARAMMAQVMAIMAATMGNVSLQRQQLAAIGPYESRGKRSSARHDQGGTRQAQRAALKARNRNKHRRACRG